MASLPSIEIKSHDPVTAVFDFLSTPAGQKVVEAALAEGIAAQQLVATLIGAAFAHPLMQQLFSVMFPKPKEPS